MALRMIMHALRMVFADLGGSLRVTGPLYLMAQVLLVAPVLLFFGTLDLEGTLLNADPMQTLDGGFLISTILGLLGYIVLSMWTAVAWHRYVLLGESDFTYPKGKVGSYFWNGLGYAILALIPAMVTFAILHAVFGQTPVLVALADAGMVIVMIFVLFRVSMGLPGLCVDNPIGFQDSWQKTKPLAGAILGIGVTMAVVAVVVTSFGTQVIGGASIAVFLISTVLGWVQFVVSLSLLTTIYGVAVEGRALT